MIYISTSYDEIWSSFLNKTKIDDLDLPNNDKAIYDTIQNAIRSFNLRMNDDLDGANASEEVNRKLDDNEILLLSHCIRLIILENQLIYFSTTFSPFSKEIGVRNIGAQMNRLENLVENEKKDINSIVLKMVDDFL